MSISTIISPIHTGPQRLTSRFSDKAPHHGKNRLGWEDLARKQMWTEAILAYLRQNWRGGVPFWPLINKLVAESLPASRAETRANTKATLAALMELVRQRRVMRFRQKTVAILDLQQAIVPLDEICRHHLAKT